MLHSVSQDYILGEGYDGLQLCFDALKIVSEHKIPRSNGGTTAYNAAYGGISQGHLKTYEYPCHKKMSYLKDVSWTYVRHTRNPRISERARRMYFSWLMSHNSPWRFFPQRLETLLPDDWIFSKEEFIYQRGWVWKDHTWPSNLQHNFLVAQRMSAEWPREITKWSHLVHDGLDPAVSFVMSDVLKPIEGRHFSENNKAVWMINQVNRYDWPLDTLTYDEEYVRNFIHGRINEKVLNPQFKDNPTYTPVNEIFRGDNVAHVGVMYPQKVFEMYNAETGTVKRLGKSEEYCRDFWKTGLGFDTFRYPTKWLLEEDDVREIIRLETERLYQ